jgi:hypothetical protein
LAQSFDVLLHRAFGDAGSARDLLVREPSRDPGHDLALAARERIGAPDAPAQPPPGTPTRDEAAKQRGHPVHGVTERPRLDARQA